MKTTEGLRNYSAGEGIPEEDALAMGMDAESKEFAEIGTDLFEIIVLP